MTPKKISNNEQAPIDLQALLQELEDLGFNIEGLTDALEETPDAQ